MAHPDAGAPTTAPAADDPDARTDASAARPVPAAPHGVRGRLHAALDRIRANPTGAVALKVTIGVLGAVVVAVGIVLIPLPGPGWALVILGLAIWAVEFVWAKHLLRFTRQHVRAWTHWIARQSLPVRLAVGTVGLLFVAAVVWLSVRIGFGVDLLDVAGRLPALA